MLYLFFYNELYAVQPWMKGFVAAVIFNGQRLDGRVDRRGALKWERCSLRRALLAIPTLFGVLVVVFLLLYVAPGDPVQEMVGERADAATIARLRDELHLDDPLLAQFAHYAGGVVRGDLGRSYITDARSRATSPSDSRRRC